MEAAYDFVMRFITSMLTFTQTVFDFFKGGLQFGQSTFMQVFRRIESFMPGPDTLNFLQDIFFSFGSVLFVVLIVRLVMTLVNLINPLS